MKKQNLYFVLGGAVSAGAYTAGVLDYFMSCLKEYMSISNQTREYEIKIKAIVGTSAGGMCGSIFLHSLAQGYPHSPENSDLYRTWVEDIDISVLSEMNDIKKGVNPNALLNGNALKIIANSIFETVPSVNDIELCNFLAKDCTLILSVTDTVGKSYAINFVNDVNEKSYYITNHRDYFYFTLSQPDTNYIELNNREAWDKLKKISIATGAFPIGLPPVEIERPSSIYQMDEELGKPFNIGGDTHKYFGIDGGIGDNEPFDQIIKLIKKNTDPDVESVILFIDPFPSENKKTEGDSIGTQIERLYSVFRNQSAFKPEEIKKSPYKEFKCYSIIPKQSVNPKVKAHLAGAFIGAFSGFIHQKYRYFDYQLGLRNCQKFLKDYYTIFNILPLRDEIPALEWPSIGIKEFEAKTKALDIRLSYICMTLFSGFYAFLIKIFLRRFKKPSELILKELEKQQLVVK
jgi:predicted acylesterase/phospholipase RssA